MPQPQAAWSATPATTAEIYAARVPKAVEELLFEVRKVIVGQDRLLERVLVALLAGGHILVEGVPGLAKTATVRAFAAAIGGKFGRIQFTPDLVPSDLVGTRVFNPRKADFSTELGPIFCNLLLADEVNRAPAKVQSALLEVMQERQVTIAKETFRVDEPFLVLATQNPIEADGTYPLPEAQIDRFMLKVVVGYPTAGEEIGIVERMIGEPIQVSQVLSPQDLVELQHQVRRVYVDPAVIAYATRLVAATRSLKAAGIDAFESAVAYGGSPRATIHLVIAGRALAFIRGRRKRGTRRFQGVDDLDGTLAKVSDQSPVILLAHEPDIFPRVPDRVALTLSGHTHGGQVRVLGYSPMVPSRFGNRYAYGHIVEDDRHLIVSGGLGCSILPVRLGMPPEIVMVDVAA